MTMLRIYTNKLNLFLTCPQRLNQSMNLKGLKVNEDILLLEKNMQKEKKEGDLKEFLAFWSIFK